MIIYGLMSYHFQYAVFKVHVFVMIDSAFLKAMCARKSRFSRSRAFCKCIRCPVTFVPSELDVCSSPSYTLSKKLRGDNEIRTRDLLLARQALSQLSYTPRESSSHLLSRTVSSKVPSAAYVLTIVFEMRTGVSHKRIATRISLFNFVLFRTLITEQYFSLLILP